MLKTRTRASPHEINRYTDKMASLGMKFRRARPDYLAAFCRYRRRRMYDAGRAVLLEKRQDNRPCSSNFIPG